MYRILDLDNALCDDSWRIKHINWHKTGNPRYHEYHLLCGFDEPSNLHLANNKGLKNIVLTGRPTMVAGITAEWLRRHGVQFEHILMRPDDSVQRSVELKSMHLSWLYTYYDIEIGSIVDAYDDHPEIVEMYRAMGIDAHQVTAHSLSAYCNPITKELAL